MPPKKPGQRRSVALPKMGGGGGIFPNFGVDLSAAMHAEPALPGVGGPLKRPTNPQGGAVKRSTKSSKRGSANSPRGTSSPADFQVTNSIRQSPLPLATPLITGKSKAGIPPPPSHGGRDSRKLKPNELEPEIPELKKTKPLPKIKDKKNNDSIKDDESVLGDVERALVGDYSVPLPEKKGRSICVFLSSTFSDMKAERNAIWSTVYPAVREHCLRSGFDFNLIDMRWGVLDYSTNYHQTEEIVLEEVKRCVNLSCATPFVSIIGQRYGSVINQRTMEKDRFDMVTDVAKHYNLEKFDLLSTWYKLDENSISPVYTLQPIDSVIPGYLSTDADVRTAASNKWSEVESQLWDLIFKACDLAFQSGKLTRADIDLVQKSVTAREVEYGIIDNNKNQRETISITRKIDGIADQLQDETTHRYIDVTRKSDLVTVDETRAENIDNYILKPVSKILQSAFYEVNWKSGGIPSDVSEQSEEEKQYLFQMCDDLKSSLIKVIDSLQSEPLQYEFKGGSVFSLIRKNPQKKNEKHVCDQSCVMKCALANQNAFIGELKSLEEDFTPTMTIDRDDFHEILHHLSFAQQKASHFCGRKNEINMVKKHFKECNWTTPLMICAEPGSGKTFFMSYIAKCLRTKNWLGDNCMVAMRFIRTSAGSADIYSLLKSLCIQISCAANAHVKLPARMTIESLVTTFQRLLTAISYQHTAEGTRLVILLDSIDTLTMKYSPFSLYWLPKQLPPYIYIIGSFVDAHGLRSTVEQRYGKYITLEAMSESDIVELFDTNLRTVGRTLITNQRTEFVNKIKNNLNPLYTNLLVAEAQKIASYDPCPQVSSTIDEAINQLFLGLEQQFGEQFVTHYLSFLTISFLGITEAEMEDMLSNSDDLLNEVYVYHPPPVEGVVRVPSHLGPIMRHQIKHLLTEKSTDSIISISWYYRQFREAAEKRYLSNGRDKKYHQIMSEVYLSENGIHRTITLSKLRKPLTVENADRQIAKQDLQHVSQRVLVSAAHHTAKIQQPDELKGRCLCNIQFLFPLWLKSDTADLIKICRKLNHDLLSLDSEIERLTEFFTINMKVMRHISLLTDEASKRLEFCTLVISSLSPKDSEPHLKELVEQANLQLDKYRSDDKLYLKPEGAQGLEQQSFAMTVVSDVQRIATYDKSSDGVVFSRTGKYSGYMFEFYDISDMDGDTVIFDNKIKQVELSIDLIYGFTGKRVILRSVDIDSLNKTLNTVNTDCLKKGDYLDNYLHVSESGDKIVLAGADQIAVLESNDSTKRKRNYTAISSLSLGGVNSTDAITMSSDLIFVISAHTIKTKQKKDIGGIVKWNYRLKSTEARCSLPSPVKRGQLYQLPEEDLLLCACTNNDIYVVSLKEQKIIQTPHKSAKWDYMSVNGFLLALLVDTEVKVFHLLTMEVREITTLKSSTCLCVDFNFNRLVVGNSKGELTVHDLNHGGLMIKEVSLTSSSIVEMENITGEYIACVDSDGSGITVNISDLIESKKHLADLETPVTHLLHDSRTGLFSGDGGAILMLTNDSDCKVLNLQDYNIITAIPSSQGMSRVYWCDGQKYVVGVKPDRSVHVWNTALGQSVKIPPIFMNNSELDESYLYCSQSQPVIMTTARGTLVYWNIEEDKTMTLQYDGLAVTHLDMRGSTVAVVSQEGTSSAGKKGEGEAWLITLIDTVSQTTIGRSSSEKEITNLACGDKSCVYISDRITYLLTSNPPTKIDLSKCSDIRYAGEDNYIILNSNKKMTVINGKTGEKVQEIAVCFKISCILNITGSFVLVLLNQGFIQLVHISGDYASNHVPVTNQMISSAQINQSTNQLHLFGRHLNSFVLSKVKMYLPKNLKK